MRYKLGVAREGDPLLFFIRVLAGADLTDCRAAGLTAPGPAET
jgi:hypothetical protein